MQQKQITDLTVQLLAYIEPKPGECTWRQFECVPYPESWKRPKDICGRFVCNGYQKKKLHPTLQHEIEED